ncbi:DUF2383 domain-containing protein [Granulosicoccus sp. 3-233]
MLDENQAALNELIVHFRESADHFEDAIDHLEDTQLQATFQDILTGHTKAADVLSEAVRKTGALPRAQHADREEVHQIITHVKAAIADDSTQVFLQDRIDHEQQIERLIAEALELDMPAETQAHLKTLSATEAVVLTRLEKALADCAS